MKDPSDIQAALQHAQRREQAGDWSAALDTYLRLPLTPRNALALTKRRMYVAEQAGLPDAAAASVGLLVDGGYPIPDRDRAVLAAILVGHVDELLERGEVEIAARSVDTALRVDAESVPAYEKRWKICVATGDSYGAEDVDRKIFHLKEDRVKRHSLAGTGLRFFSATYMIKRIGEICHHFEITAKAQRLGWLPAMHCILLAPEREIVNAALMAYWSRYFSVVSDPTLMRRLAPLAAALEFDSDRISVPGRGPVPKVKAHKLVQRQWENEERPPLLELLHEHHRDGWRQLGRFGMTPDDWFVCLHVREAGYLGFERDNPSHYHRWRNADVSRFLPACREIVARGGWVIRMGDPGVMPLPDVPRVVDYALSDSRSDWMDVFLCSENRFFIGTSSGLFMVASSFGRPVVMTNPAPMTHTSFSKHDICLPKLYRRVAEEKPLSFSESLRPPFRDLLRGDTLSALGYTVVDNSAEDIRDATVEMLDRLAGRDDRSDEDETLQRRVRALFEETDNVLLGRIAKGFLSRHRDLL